MKTRTILRLVAACLVFCFLGGCATSSKPQPVPGENFFRRGTEESVVLEEPAAYQYLFQKVEKALFVRKSLETSPSKK